MADEVKENEVQWNFLSHHLARKITLFVLSTVHSWSLRETYGTFGPMEPNVDARPVTYDLYLEDFPYNSWISAIFLPDKVKFVYDFDVRIPGNTFSEKVQVFTSAVPNRREFAILRVCNCR